MIDITFDTPAWEAALVGCPKGGTLSAARFLAMMEQESEESFQEALELLQQRDILLDTKDLPAVTCGAEMAQRLAWEKQLVAEGKLPEGLEENDPLRLYLQELAQLPRQTLMEQMLDRVTAQAFALAGQGVLLVDLIQEGSLGLWQTIERNPAREACERGIRQALARALVTQARENGVGGKLRQALEDYRTVDEQLLSDLGRNPTLEEIAQKLHINPEAAQTLAQMVDTARAVSRAKSATEEKEPEPEDTMAVEDTAYFQMRQRIAELLSGLSEEDARLISLRYGLEGGLPLTAEETARKLGLTAAQVTVREAAALVKLRNS